MPVLLAAMALRILDLGDEQTDGTLLWMTGPAAVRDYVVPRSRPRPVPRACPARGSCAACRSA